ncbi:hypothetical protein GWI33_021465 [Rhynchophorus ferrugineus]|nr:hypothetical protein GWI33_021465 [Rhynchophorus ferrugineus]
MLPHPPYSPDLAPSDYFVFPDLKKCSLGRNFRRMKMAETEAYFEAKHKSYYKNSIEKLEGPYNQCISLEENYVE